MQVPTYLIMARRSSELGHPRHWNTAWGAGEVLEMIEAYANAKRAPLGRNGFRAQYIDADVPVATVAGVDFFVFRQFGGQDL